MMRFCKKLHFSSKNLIFLIALGLALDITLLSLFSAWSSTAQGRHGKFYLAGVIITSCVVALLLYLLKKAYRLKVREDVEIAVNTAADMESDAEFLNSLSGLPTRFSFKDLESATNAFTTKLGRGGFGSVYAGTLLDGTKIAVKRLEKEGRGQKEFCAEVATISKIRHVNLVCLKGFCAEGVERLLVYEYMPRGSLDRWIFCSSELESQVPLLSPDLPSSSAFVVLDWDTRCRIALEIARGLAYLHEECEEAILHLDVKPQNILLDEHFRVKVSDFGLSRSMDKAQSRLITTVRGTPGYLAPEWFTDGGIDVKIDVYGYGMVVLELISGRRSVDQSQDDIEDWFLPSMVFKKLKENRATHVIDPLLQEKLDEESCKQALRIIKVALWCIQEDAAKRPNMSNVVQMLESKMEVMEPPLSRNFLASRRNGNALCTSITISDPETLTLPR